jgi:hypothetical protein
LDTTVLTESASVDYRRLTGKGPSGSGQKRLRCALCDALVVSLCDGLCLVCQVAVPLPLDLVPGPGGAR